MPEALQLYSSWMWCFRFFSFYLESHFCIQSGSSRDGHRPGKASSVQFQGCELGGSWTEPKLSPRAQNPSIQIKPVQVILRVTLGAILGHHLEMMQVHLRLMHLCPLQVALVSVPMHPHYQEMMQNANTSRMHSHHFQVMRECQGSAQCHLEVLCTHKNIAWTVHVRVLLEREVQWGMVQRSKLMSQIQSKSDWVLSPSLVELTTNKCDL